jgi:hypothetical protein
MDTPAASSAWVLLVLKRMGGDVTEPPATARVLMAASLCEAWEYLALAE